jgi:putative phosphoesterase
MKIAVISDTHARHLGDLPVAVVSALIQSDMILHLGDFEHRELVDDLKKINRFYGVTGNHDFAKIREVLPTQDIIEINGKRIGLIHGHGCSVPFGMFNGMRRRFKGEKLDAIIFGHTHRKKNRVLNDILFFNPGSACGRFPAYHGSFGILTVEDTITSEIFPARQAIPITPSTVCVYLANCFRTIIPQLKLKPDRP